MTETKSLEMRRVVDDFVDFTTQINFLENETEKYYWFEEAIIRAADKLKEIGER